MAAGNSTLVIVCVGVLAFAAGWFGHGWFYGTHVSTKSAAEQSQEFVTAAVEDDRKIVAAQAESDVAEEQVRAVFRTVTVEKECPPGRGAVSQPITDELRTLFATDE